MSVNLSLQSRVKVSDLCDFSVYAAVRLKKLHDTDPSCLSINRLDNLTLAADYHKIKNTD